MKEYVTDEDIKRIFESVGKNEYMKEINRGLKGPRGKKGIQFKAKEITKFKESVNKDIEKSLL